MREEEIVRSLLNDDSLSFKERGGWLRQGVCPSCGKKELYINKLNPWVLKCGRLNNCGYEESIRDRYPELFDGYKKRFPATPNNPNATADAYLKEKRGFNLEKIKGMYEQGAFPFGDNVFGPTVRFPFLQGYWQRFIDEEDVRRFGDKTHIKKDTGYRNHAWIPPDMEINNGDTIYIVEGIFHAIAFLHVGLKAIAAISSSNLPRKVIEEHPEVNWVLAYDNDKAGQHAIIKFTEELEEKGIDTECCITVGKKDWDEVYNEGNLDEKYLEQGLYRGRLLTAKNITEKAFHIHLKTNSKYIVTDHHDRMYAITVENELTKKVGELINEGDGEFKDGHDFLTRSDDAIDVFRTYAKATIIANCVPEFLYCEIDKFTNEIAYFFKVTHGSGQKESKVVFTGSAIESPASLNKSLLNQAAGATFDGKSHDLKIIRDRWFNKKILHVSTVPFVGYDKGSEMYVYQDFGFYKGRLIKPNNHEYLDNGRTPIKTNFKGFNVVKSNNFPETFLRDFHTVFGYNGITALGFWFGSLFAEQIRSETKSFPFLELTGEHGTGKSTLIEFLWKLVGKDDYEGFDPSKATFAARARAFQQVSNFPVVLIESDRDEPGAKQRAFDFEELKTAFNGRAIRSIGVAKRGADTEDPPFRASIVIAQNAQVAGTPALMSRIIHCHFTKAHFTKESFELSKWFASVETEDIAGFLIKALQQEEKIIKHIINKTDVYLNKLTEVKDVTDQRIILNHAKTAAMIDALRFIFPDFNDDWAEQSFNHISLRAIDRQKSLNADHSSVALFWDNYDLINDRPSKDDDYYSSKETLNHSSNDEEIAINLNHYYQEVSNARLEMIATSDLKKLLPNSKRHKFKTIKTVRSNIWPSKDDYSKGKPVYCWVFEKKESAR